MPSDVPAMSAILGDAETMRYIGPGFQRGLTAEETGAAIARMSDAYERNGIGIWPVVVKATGELAGECGLQAMPGTSDVEVAYIFGKAHRGNGYAIEAARAVVEFGFRERSLPSIVALVHRFNAPSIALINKLGMRFERVVRAYHADLLQYRKAKPISV